MFYAASTPSYIDPAAESLTLPLRWLVLILIGLAVTFSLYAIEHRQVPATAAGAANLASNPGARVLLTSDQKEDALVAGGFIQPIHSLLQINGPLRYGDYVWNDKQVAPGPIFIRVDLRTQLLSVFRGGHEIGTSVIVYGADSKKTPLGRFPVLWKGKNHRSSLYDAPMPFTLRLTGDGVAIHGSDVRWGAATHGCIGIPTNFARHLFTEAKVGDPVVILRSKTA
jgi:hypothetical protein